MNKKSGATVVWLARWRESRGASSVHSQKVVGSQVLPFPCGGRNKAGPRRRRDALALPPFASHPMTHAEVAGHAKGYFGRGLSPEGEHVGEVLHDPHIARDGLSRQEAPRFPVPSEPLEPENNAMGRARSPVQFNKDLALRLRSARVAAGYQSGEVFARELGISYERYKKWESGRTPIQHEYLPRACELTGKDANYFYGLDPEPQRIIG